MGYELKSPVASTRLAEALGLEHRGPTLGVARVGRLDRPEAGSLVFQKAASANTTCRQSLLIAPSTVTVSEGCAQLVSAHPRLDFMRSLCWLEENVEFVQSAAPPTVHPTARVSPFAAIDNDVEIGAHSVIQPHVTLHPGTRIGSHCLIRSGADIGGEGFGYERLDDGTPLKFVHLGGVRIGDYVEIGANTCVVRGSLGDTTIQDHAKIDNLVHIAHNCTIGRGSFVIAGAEVSGGVVIGENAWVGPNAAIIQQVRVGSGAVIGIGAVVTKDVPAGQTVAGSPAQEISEFIRLRKLIAKLPSSVP